MKVGDLTRFLDQLAPRSHAESYDNVGLLVGDTQKELDAVLVSLDCTEEVIEEAERRGAGLVVCHHPIVFKGLKSLTGRNYVERTVIRAIKSDIAIYAIHTNLDNQIHGVNAEIARRIGMTDVRILRPKGGELSKLVVYCPLEKLGEVQDALFTAGAGEIGAYSECSFSSEGVGTFKAGDGADPYVGKVGQRHREAEYRLEVLVQNDRLSQVVRAMKQAHPYEEVAFDILPLANSHDGLGSGMVGKVPSMHETEFLALLKNNFGTGAIKHTPLLGKDVETVAICGGSGSFLIGDAKAVGADFYVTGDVKYHEFYDAEDKLVIADIGHYESEQYTKDLLAGQLMEKFPNFAIHLSEVDTNPVKYY